MGGRESGHSAEAARAVVETVQRNRRHRRSRNNVKRLREDRLLSKAEFARKAGLSALTIDRVEAGFPCRMDTKRKIILALGMTVEEKDQVFLALTQDVDAEEVEESEGLAIVANGQAKEG